MQTDSTYFWKNLSSSTHDSFRLYVLTKHFEYLIDSSADEVLISSPDFDLVDDKQGSSLPKKDLIFALL